jgi:hypothetical protein
MRLFLFKYKNYVSDAATAAAAAAPAAALGAGSETLENPLKFDSICGLIHGILDAVMVIGIPIAILFMVWAGFQFVLAQGNAEKLGSARKNFLNVIIGIAIFVGASLIAQVIVNTVAQLGVNGINSCQ